MNMNELTIHAGAQLISSEMQDVFEKVVFLIPNWKWLALITGIVALGFVKVVFGWAIKKIKLENRFSGGKTFIQFFVKLEIEKSGSWILTALLAHILIDSLDLTLNMDKYLTIAVKIIMAINLIRLGYLAADAFGTLAQQWAAKTESTIDDQLAPLATKALKVIVVVFGLIMLMQSLKIEVAPILAGLGIGGVALAFAAQDTVANVFGTITIILDAPFKMGDRIKLGDIDGLVEEVGFRSTRIRTFYNSVITLPNSVVAKEKIDNMTERNGMVRFRQIVTLTYDVTMAQVQEFITHLTFQLKQDPTVDKNRISITLNAFADSSINVQVIFHFQMQAGDDENIRNEEYLTLIHDLVTKMKLEFAFPTQTMIVQNKQTPPIQGPTSP